MRPMVQPRAQVTKVCLPFQASPYLGTALPQLAFPTSMAYLPSSAAAPAGSAGSQAVSAAPGGHGHQQMMHPLLAGQHGGATNGTGGTSTSVVHHMKPRSDRIEVRTTRC